MTDRNIFEAHITLPSDNSILLLESLSIIGKYIGNDIKLYANDKGRIYYTVPINKLLDKDISEEDAIKLRNASWKIDGDNLIKDM